MNGFVGNEKDNDPLPPTSHITKLVKKSLVHNGGKIDGKALLPRPKEDYMSVNWLEYDGNTDLEVCVQNIINIYKDKLKVKKNDRLPIINVQRAIEYVKAETDDRRKIQILYKPELKPDHTYGDPSHSGVYGYSHEDVIIGELLTDIVQQVHRAENFLSSPK